MRGEALLGVVELGWPTLWEVEGPAWAGEVDREDDEVLGRGRGRRDVPPARLLKGQDQIVISWTK